MNGWFRCRAPSEDPVMFALGFDAMGLRLRDSYLELLAFCSSNRRDGIFRTGRDFVGQVETAARWRGKKGALVNALLAAGAIVGNKNDGFTVLNDGRWGTCLQTSMPESAPEDCCDDLEQDERRRRWREYKRAQRTIQKNVDISTSCPTQNVDISTSCPTEQPTEQSGQNGGLSTPCPSDRKTRARDERQKTKNKNNDNISSTESVTGTGAAENSVPVRSSPKATQTQTSTQLKPPDADLSLDTPEATRWKAPSEKNIWDEPKIEVKNPDFPRTSVLCRLLWDSFEPRKRDLSERELFEAIKPFEKTLPDRKSLRSIVVRFFSSLDWLRDHGRYRPKLSTFVEEEMWTWDDPEQDGDLCDYIWFLEKRRDRLERLGVHLPLVMDPLKIPQYKAPITAWVARRADMWGLAEKLERADAAKAEGRAA